MAGTVEESEMNAEDKAHMECSQKKCFQANLTSVAIWIIIVCLLTSGKVADRVTGRDACTVL